MNTVELGKRVRRLRKERRLSQQGLAALAGVDRSTIARCENAIGTPETETLHAIAEKLGTSVLYLTDGVGEAPREAPAPGVPFGVMQLPVAIVELLASAALGPVTLSEVRDILADGKNADPYDFEVQLWVRRAMKDTRDPDIRARLNEALDKRSAAEHEQTISVARRPIAGPIRNKPPAAPSPQHTQPRRR